MFIGWQWGTACASGELGSRKQDPLAWNSVRAKAPMVTDALGDGCGCGEAAPMSLGFYWVGVQHRMCLWELGSRDHGPSTGNPDTNLSRCNQGQGSGEINAFLKVKIIKIIKSDIL